MMKYLFKILFITICVVSISSCRVVTNNHGPESIGKFYEYEKKLVKGGDFWITTYQKITDRTKPFVFYIESDGAAFTFAYQVSYDPTPRHHVLFSLIAMDDRPNIVYIARPCQYTPMELNPKCTNPYWTSKRLSDDSVDAINQVIMSINNKKEFSLIGYSGGGGVAVLIAARNPLVKNIITVAGNLDHKAFTSYHRVTPMVESLNPIDYAQKINKIPQMHFSGGKDRVVPPFIADKFVQESNSKCVKQYIFEKNTHNYGWEKKWKYILSLPVVCY